MRHIADIKSPSLPPYDYKLPLDPKISLTKNLRMGELSQLIIEPTAFESTSYVLAFGKDLFITKTSPDKQFDRLQETFDKGKLLAVMGVCVLGVIVTELLKKRTEAANKFKATFS